MSQIIITINITSDDEVDVQLPPQSGPRGIKSDWFLTIDKFGERLSQARRNTPYTQQSLADKLGVSQSAVTEWEKGRAYPKRNRIETIAQLLNTTPEYLITGEENEDTIS
jgi:DNA-binding XRE family transcriptional regulator